MPADLQSAPFAARDTDPWPGKSSKRKIESDDRHFQLATFNFLLPEADDESWTRNLSITNRLLRQLSYVGTFAIVTGKRLDSPTRLGE